MSQTDRARQLRAHFRRRADAADEHPAPEELVAYRDGTLDPGPEKELQAHLLRCAECADLLLDLAALERTGGRTRPASEHEVEASWRGLRRCLFPGRRRTVWRYSVWRYSGWAAAACLALVAGALTLELREARRASLGFYSLDLPRVIAEERGKRSPGADLPVLELAAGEPGLVLLLLRDDARYASFRAELTTLEGRSLLVREGLSAAENLLLIQVPPRLLPAGVVRVAVSGERQGRHEPVEEYALRVRHR